MTYRVEGYDRTFNSAEAVVEQLIDCDGYDEDDFDEYLDECYEKVDVAGNDYPLSSVLKNVDEYRYNEWFSEWCSDEVSSRREDEQSELERLDPGESYDINGCTVYAVDDGRFEDEEDEDVMKVDDVMSILHGIFKQEDDSERPARETESSADVSQEPIMESIPDEIETIIVLNSSEVYDEDRFTTPHTMVFEQVKTIASSPNRYISHDKDHRYHDHRQMDWDYVLGMVLRSNARVKVIHNDDGTVAELK